MADAVPPKFNAADAISAARSHMIEARKLPPVQVELIVAGLLMLRGEVKAQGDEHSILELVQIDQTLAFFGFDSASE